MMPRMRLRVVCGLGLMMASFSPTRALSKVDLPALGRPRMQTKPEWKDMIYRLRRLALLGWTAEAAVPTLVRPLYQLHLFGVGVGDADAFHAAVGGFEDFEAEAIFLDDFALLRDSSG